MQLVTTHFDVCPRCEMRHERDSKQQKECAREALHGAIRYLVTEYYVDGAWVSHDIMTATLLLNTEFVNLIPMRVTR